MAENVGRWVERQTKVASCLPSSSRDRRVGRERPAGGDRRCRELQDGGGRCDSELRARITPRVGSPLEAPARRAP